MDFRSLDVASIVTHTVPLIEVELYALTVTVDGVCLLPSPVPCE